MSWKRGFKLNIGLRWSVPGQTRCRLSQNGWNKARGDWTVWDLLWPSGHQNFSERLFILSLLLLKDRKILVAHLLYKRYRYMWFFVPGVMQRLRARKTFGRFSIVLYRLHFNVESDQSGVDGFFFFPCWYVMKKLQTCWKSKWCQNTNFILLWLCALSFLSNKVVS